MVWVGFSGGLEGVDEIAQGDVSVDEAGGRASEIGFGDTDDAFFLDGGERLPVGVAQDDFGFDFVGLDAAPGEDEGVGCEGENFFVGERAAFDLFVADGVLSADELDEVIDPALLARGKDGFGPPLDEEARGGCERGQGLADLLHLVDHSLGSVGDAESIGDLLDVVVDISQRGGFWSDERQRGRCQPLQNSFMPWYGEGGEDDVRLERSHRVDVDLEVRPELGQRLDDLCGKVGVVVDADEQVATTKGADDLRVGAAKRNHTHDALLVLAAKQDRRKAIRAGFWVMQ